MPAADAQECVDKWQARGYKVAIFRDGADDSVRCDILHKGQYKGYARAVNLLAGLILRSDPDAEWIVTGGDDTEPDATKTADEIGAECTAHFGGTFGVMQPTGDRWGADKAFGNYVGSAYIDRVAGSPWLGREWCRRMYGGEGPLWGGWLHMFVDEELQDVAQMLGAFQQRPDLTHFHRHWARRRNRQMPAYLAKANARFAADRQLFNERKAAFFPGHEPII